jgi:hypothetical protein
MLNVSKKFLAGLASAVLATACLGFAARGHKSSERGTNVTFSNTSRLKDGTTLPAGTYRMEVPEGSTTPKVEFYRNGKVIATANAKVVNETRKNSTTEVDSVKQGNEQVVTAIRPSGWNERLEFGNAQ